MQPSFEWSAPFQGSTPASTHASWTGAQAVQATWTARQSGYLQLLNQAGALNDYDAAALRKCAVSSINSVRNAINRRERDAGRSPLIVPDGHDPHTFVDESGAERHTQRTRWRIRR